MSRGQKKQKRSVATQYEAVCNYYGPVPEKIKEERFHSLLFSLPHHKVSSGLLHSLLDHEGKLLFGEIHTAAPIPDIPRVAFYVSGVVGAVAIERKVWTTFHHDQDGNVIVSIEDDILVVPRQASVFLAIHAENALPYDMRKWPGNLSQLFIRSKFHHLQPGLVSNVEKTGRILTSHYNLVKIRKINPQVSRKQVKKIAAESGGLKEENPGGLEKKKRKKSPTSGVLADLHYKFEQLTYHPPPGVHAVQYKKTSPKKSLLVQSVMEGDYTDVLAPGLEEDFAAIDMSKVIISDA